jgi:hypothetical protein
MGAMVVSWMLYFVSSNSNRRENGSQTDNNGFPMIVGDGPATMRLFLENVEMLTPQQENRFWIVTPVVRLLGFLEEPRGHSKDRTTPWS